MLERAERQAIEEIAKEWGLWAVVLFGSTVRGQARPDSDVDLGVLPSRGSLSYRELGELGRRFSERLPRRADVVDLSSADALVRFEIVRDGEVVYLGSRDEWVACVARTLIDHDDVAWHLPELIAGVGRAAGAEQ